MATALATFASSSSMVPTLISVGTSVIGAIGQAQQAQAQAQAQAEAQRRAAEQRNIQARHESESLRARQAQEEEKLAREKMKASIQAREARSRSEAAAAGAGITGISVENLIQDYSMQEAFYLESLERQQQYVRQGTDLDVKNVMSGANAQNIASAYPVGGGGPSMLGTGLNIMGDLYTGYTRAKQEALGTTSNASRWTSNYGLNI